MPRVQRLYEACKVSFLPSGGVPSPEAVELVKSALDDITSFDVGLQDSSIQNELAVGRVWSKRCGGHRSSTVSGWAPPITYLHLYECENFLSMGIFCLPAGAAIPLHNHPGMTVFSKLLYGSMHVRSFNWIHPSDKELIAGPSEARLAKLVEDHVITVPCETEILYPTSGNIHSFKAVTSCAVLDVLAPPYSTKDGRRCTYYKESRFSGAIHEMVEYAELDLDGESSYSSLQEFQPPKNFIVKEGIYKGPKVRP
ncbi:hypothetical protein O6H91_08G117500 [Diphasiastrum complanatum]|uniref:Uncharacterized protein n=1 Tax=Diphasiastrum complanatum TaxID=34168 RepID=A0ACC2D1K5_DIPCM|nr:hypothetical protein O6H91_08G117500 [Diphasiastrum complanatum]